MEKQGRSFGPSTSVSYRPDPPTRFPVRHKIGDQLAWIKANLALHGMLPRLRARAE